MKVQNIVSMLNSSLDVTQKELSSLLGVSSEALGRSKDDNFDVDAKTKIQMRLSNLMYALIPLLDLPLEPRVRLSILRQLEFRDINDNLDSVISALKSDKYQKELLRVIAKEAYSSYLQKKSKENQALIEVKSLFKNIESEEEEIEARSLAV